MATHGHASGGHGPRSGAVSRVWTRKWTFLAVFLLVFFTSTSILGALDLLPESSENLAEENKPSLSASASLALADPEKPVLIEIPAIDMSVPVENPTSTNVEVLDRALLSGAVRHPSSSNLGEAGNVIIFGHSSYLPIVRNPHYKAFNDIQKLKEGDRILVTGSDRTFVYEVQDVVRADADEDAIPLTVDGSMLTLATCDSFGAKSDRFVVTAELVESYPTGT